MSKITSALAYEAVQHRRKLLSNCLRLSFLICCSVLASQAAAQEPKASPDRAEVIEGSAVALDGDTLLIAGMSVRIFGIEAPDMITPLGPHARAKLDDLLTLGPVSCKVLARDGAKRPIAHCTAGRNDLALLQLLTGMATTNRILTYAPDADPRLAAEYDKAEHRARNAKAGLWAPCQCQ
jgi:endonuclease YncB( thermonuclease family)